MLSKWKNILFLIAGFFASEARAAPYSGHGAASVPKSVLDRFAPKPVPAAIAGRIERLMDLRSENSWLGHVLSPDGRRLYMNWDVTGSYQVWRLDGPGTFPVQITSGADLSRAVDVTPDGKKLIIQRDRKGEENPGLYVLDTESGAIEMVQHVTNVQTEYQGRSADGRFAYFRANDQAPDSYAIYRYDLIDKRREMIYGEPGLWSVADIAPSGALLLFKETGSRQEEYYLLPPGAKNAMPLFGQGEKNHYEARFGASEHEVLVLTDSFGDYARLYVFEQGKFAPLSADVGHDIDCFAVPMSRDRVVYSLNDEGYLRLHVIDLKKRQEIAAPSVPEGVALASAGSSTPDGRYTILYYEWENRPASSVVYDWQTGTSTAWLKPSLPEVGVSEIARASLVLIPVRDGSSIPAFVRRGPKCLDTATPCPVIVYFHGGPEGQSLPGFDLYLQVLVDAGYIVVSPNVRGSTGRGKKYVSADNGPKRLDVITDIEDVGLWVDKTFQVNGLKPKKGALGVSYGGYSVLKAMTRFAGTYDVGFSVVGISNLLTFLANTAPYRRALRINEYGDPVKDRAALVELSPVTHVRKLRAPLYLVQGANDPRVPVGEAIQFYELIKKSGVPSGMTVFDDEGHGTRNRKNTANWLGRAVEWFDRYLKAGQIS